MARLVVVTALLLPLAQAGFRSLSILVQIMIYQAAYLHSWWF